MSSSPENYPPFHPPRRLLLKACASGVLVGAAGFGTAAWAQPLALSTAINRAGRLRALSQRITKAYTQVTLDVLPERSLEVIALGQNLVRTSLVELGSAGFPAEISALLAVCRTDSEHLLSLVTGTPAAAVHLGDINKAADQMLASAERLTGRLEGSGKASAKILNIAGRQRMLSQRIAKCFMLIEAGQDPTVLSKQLETARSEFALALDTLEAAPVSTKAIKENLALARMQWMFFQSALNGRDKIPARRDVATTSERVLEVIDSLTGLYDAALKELLGGVAYNDTRYAGLWQSAG